MIYLLLLFSLFGFSQAQWTQEPHNSQDSVKIESYTESESDLSLELSTRESETEIDSTSEWNGELDSIGELRSRKPANQSPSNTSSKISSPTKNSLQKQSLSDFISFFQNLYQMPDVFTKLVDNRGDGYDNLYGVRNFRTVLNGVLYRSGANNAYNKHRVRNNQNPLPAEGLQNLCSEGFQTAVYMYSTNYQPKLSPVQCQARQWPSSKAKNTLTYLQISPWNRSAQYKILKLVFEHINGQKNGPILLHCWNGWHASGLISALALRQFCEWTGKTAVDYWNQNTDGNHSGKVSESYRKQIMDFQRFVDLKIEASAKNKICFPADVPSY